MENESGSRELGRGEWEFGGLDLLDPRGDWFECRPQNGYAGFGYFQGR
jgi:hypothetical protein